MIMMIIEGSPVAMVQSKNLLQDAVLLLRDQGGGNIFLEQLFAFFLLSPRLTLKTSFYKHDKLGRAPC